MPRLKKIQPLSRMCIDFISNNMDKFCMKSTVGKLEQGDTHFLEGSTNHFDILSSVALKDIVKVLRKKYHCLVEEEFLLLLITPHLCTLDLSLTAKISDMEKLLQLASTQNPNLKTLLIAYKIFNENFFSHIAKFTKLHILDISYTTAGDNCFDILGRHCYQLRILKAEYCQVTNAGIEGLCVRGQCKLITVLYLRETKVTKEGIQMVLHHLPTLRELDHSVVEVLAQISETALDNKLAGMPTFSLTHLKILDKTPYRSGSLGAAASICPLVTKVRIYNDGNITDKDIQGLLILERLSDLHICGCPKNSFTFFGGIVPILMNRGRSLKNLTLYVIQGVDIAIIVEYCLNLSSLTVNLSEFSTFNTDNIRSDEIEILPQPKRFENSLPVLKNLEFLCLYEALEIPPEHLILLLSSPALKVIDIFECDTLSDALLQTAASLHSFRNLVKFIIDNCYLVTEKVMNILMQDSNPLKRIEVTWDEGNHLAANFEEIIDGWKKEIILKNWDLDLNCKIYEI